ncbi:MAG: ATP:cob(I)alamin adenosyltransferase [Verrucomicrobia bacterium]|nr:ATP:cob(I)alamin adenosyltransferase [Verrucomicrobiota bacterium]
MSISTRKGDLGSTSLLFNIRVPKDHAQIEANGRLDELLKALGIARAFSVDLSPRLRRIQEDLSCIMAEIAIPEGMRDRFAKAGYNGLRAELLVELDAEIQALENILPRQTGWEWPGEHQEERFWRVPELFAAPLSARFYSLSRSHPTVVTELHLKTLNRLSDWLHLQGRASVWVCNREKSCASCSLQRSRRSHRIQVVRSAHAVCWRFCCRWGLWIAHS